MRSKRSLCFFIAFLFLFSLVPANSQAQTSIEVEGVISADTTWSADTIKITGDVEVQSGVTLTIEPGTRVEFQGNYQLFFNYATLRATGTETDSIVFTVSDTTGFWDQSVDSGGWKGIKLFEIPESGDSSDMQYCIIEYAKSGRGLHLDHHSKIKIKNCVIRHNRGPNSGGMLITGGKPYVHGNQFYNNFTDYGSAININTSDPSIGGNSFENNTSDGGIIHCSWGGPTIKNNSFKNNSITGNLSGVIFVWRGLWNTVIDGNMLANNSVTGTDPGMIFVRQTDRAIISNNLVVNNEGSGVFVDRCDPLFINNTIANNLSDYGGGIYINDGSPRIINTILWENSARDQGNQVFINKGNPEFLFCNIEGDSSDFEGDNFSHTYKNNISADPMFISASAGAGTGFDGLAGNWELEYRSSCINTGMVPEPEFLPDLDIINNIRIIHGRTDIGAYEAHITKLEVSGDIISDTLWIADTIKINGPVKVADSARLTIAPGSIVEFQGAFDLDIWGTLIARGNENAWIRFTARDTAGITDPLNDSAGWTGITFGSGHIDEFDTSVMSWCIIEYARPSGAIQFFSCDRLVMHDLIFRNNFGITLNFNAQSKVTIGKSEFYNNIQHSGGILRVLDSDVELYDNVFHDNYSQHYLIDCSGSTLKISRNEFFQNHRNAWGMISSTASIVSIDNSLMYNNQSGYGQISSHISKMKISNSTISNNLNNYAAIYIRSGENLLVNNIIWGNGHTDIPDPRYQVYIEGDDGIIDFYNCNIQGGAEKFNWGWLDFTGIYENCIDTLPHFTSPSGGLGLQYDVSGTDWSLLSISPSIDAGTTDIPNIIPPEYDLSLDPRINNGTIDMGAFENQSTTLISKIQPWAKFLCEGDSTALLFLANDTANYQWYRDEVPIPGETGPMIVIDSAVSINQGSYHCTSSNRYGQISSNSVPVYVRIKPQFQNEPGETWITPGESHTLRTFAFGTDLNYQWRKESEDIPGAVTPDYQIINADFQDEGIYRCIISNTCGSDTTGSIPLYLAPQLCMVTVSPTTGNNLVIWEKNSQAPIMAFNVYRESVAAGIYDRLVTVPYDELSVYVDTTADPTVQAYLYKVTAIDTSGSETDIDLCLPHKTIHLIVSTNPELKTTQLQWDRYYGFDYQTYTIYKSTTGLNFDPVHSLSASLNSWTDPDPVTGDLFYRIAVEKPDPCYPEGGEKKAGTGPYVNSLSNMDNNKLKAGEIPPDSIWLSDNTIDEELAAGTVVGKLFTRDGDSLDSHSYKFVPGDGSEDNISFTIAGDLLMASGSFDYETENTYSIRVRSTDEAGNYYEASFIINIADIDEATWTGFSEEGRISIFPNPLNQEAKLRIPNPGGKPYKLTITDISGKVCRMVKGINTSEYILKKGNLSSGIYFVELKGHETYRGRLLIE